MTLMVMVTFNASVQPCSLSIFFFRLIVAGKLIHAFRLTEISKSVFRGFKSQIINVVTVCLKINSRRHLRGQELLQSRKSGDIQ